MVDWQRRVVSIVKYCLNVRDTQLEQRILLFTRTHFRRLWSPSCVLAQCYRSVRSVWCWAGDSLPKDRSQRVCDSVSNKQIIYSVQSSSFMIFHSMPWQCVTVVQKRTEVCRVSAFLCWRFCWFQSQILMTVFKFRTSQLLVDLSLPWKVTILLCTYEQNWNQIYEYWMIYWGERLNDKKRAFWLFLPGVVVMG